MILILTRSIELDQFHTFIFNAILLIKSQIFFFKTLKNYAIIGAHYDSFARCNSIIIIIL